MAYLAQTLDVAKSIAGLSLNAPSQRRHVIDHVIEPSLEKISECELITEDHPCFAPAREFRDRWGIRPKVWSNFSRLLQGWRQSPLILLQNPSNTHGMAFEEMIQGHTLGWISAQLGTSHLSIDQVPILDSCSFFSKDDLLAMDEARRYKAIEASRELGEEILATLKPNVILCCQCTTKGYQEHGREVRRPAANPLAQQLCSSIQATETEQAVVVDIRGHQAWVVKGFHPAYLLREPNKEPILLGVFREIYEPFTRWKRRVVIETLEEMMNKIDMFISELEGCKSKLDSVSKDKTLVTKTSELISTPVQFREDFQSIIQHLKAGQ